MKEKIKVLFFISSLEGGGAERVMVNILSHIDKSRIEPTLSLLYPYEKSPYKAFLPEELKVIVVERKSDSFFAKLWQLVNFIKTVYREKPNLILSMLTHNNIMALLAKKFVRTKVIVSEHNTLGETIKIKGGKEILGIPVKPMVKLLYPHADIIIAVSEGIKNNLVEEFRLPANKVKVIYNPIDLKYITELSSMPLNHPFWVSHPKNTGIVNKDMERSFLSSQSARVNPQPVSKHHIPIVIAVGRLAKQKRFDILIEAFSNVLSEIDARLVILGDGNKGELLKKLVEDKDIAGKVSFAGFQKNPYNFLSASDIFVLSSDYEGLPMVLLEAMACATPVIATDCKSGPREILNNGMYGILVPTGDVTAISEAIINLLKDKPLRDRLGSLGMERAADFSADRIIRQYEEMIYESIVE